MGILDTVSDFASDAAAFGKGVAAGAGAAVEGLAEGAWDTVKAGYSLATSPEARDRAFDAARDAADAAYDYASRAVDDPMTAVNDARDAALDALEAADDFRRTAGPDAWGRLVGGGAVNAVPITRVARLGRIARAADAAPDAPRPPAAPVGAADEAADAARAADRVEDAPPGCTTGCPRPPVLVSETARTPGGNVATWTIDERGRPVRVEATLTELAGGARSSAEKTAQTAVGKTGVADDEGGHLIGHRFLGDQGMRNLIPQNANLNRGAWKTMENEWADWIASGREVKVFIDVVPPGAERPRLINVEYEVIDRTTGEAIYLRGHEFVNGSGQDFARMSSQEIFGQ